MTIDRWTYATLVIEQKASDVTWTVVAVNCAEGELLDETIAGQTLYRADIVNAAGAHGYEAYAVDRSTAPVTGSEAETFCLKRRT